MRLDCVRLRAAGPDSGPYAVPVRATLGSPYGKTPRSTLVLSRGIATLNRPEGLASLSRKPPKLVDSSGILHLLSLRHNVPLASLYALVIDHDSYSIASLGGREAAGFEAAARGQNFEVEIDVIPTWMWISSGLIARRWRSLGAISPNMEPA